MQPSQAQPTPHVQVLGVQIGFEHCIGRPAVQLTSLPKMAPSTGGDTTTIRNAMSAPPMHAVAQTLPLARVSAPMIWPSAYTTAPTRTRSMPTTGKRAVSEPQSEEIAAGSSPSWAKSSPNNEKDARKTVNRKSLRLMG